MKKLLAITFSLTVGIMPAQDSLTPTALLCQANPEMTDIYALPLKPLSVEIELNIDFNELSGTRVLYVRATKWNFLSETFVSIPGPGVYDLSVSFPAIQQGVGQVHFDLKPSVTSLTTTATLDLSNITIIHDVVTPSFENYGQNGAFLDADVMVADYNLVSLCADYQSYVMLEALAENDNVVLADSMLQEFQGPVPAYEFHTPYDGMTTTVCLRTWIRVHNIADGTFTDIEGSAEVCGIELVGFSTEVSEPESSPLRITRRGDDIIIIADEPGTYEIFEVNGALLSNGTFRNGSTTILAADGISIVRTLTLSGMYQAQRIAPAY